MLLPFKHQIVTFPADYIYFNEFSGGNKKAWSNFDYDYYFHGIKKSSEYLIDIVDGENVNVACNCNLSNYFEKVENINFQYTTYLQRSSVHWDYGLFGVNYIHPTLLKSGKWQSSNILKTFYHRGNPIAVLIKRKNTFDFEGIEELMKGDLEKAKSNLKKAVNEDPNNIWLLVQLAKISLKENDFKSFNRYLQQGREIYPDYEPFFLLEANYWFEKKDYPKSYEVLNEVLKINPRYENAVPLLNAVKEKLNHKVKI